MTYRVLYVSQGADNLTGADLASILQSAHDYNQSAGITGLLLFHKGTFLQLLEGDREQIENLLRKIEKDSRNQELDVIHEEESGARMFSDWSMSFVPLDPNDPVPLDSSLVNIMDPKDLMDRVSGKTDALANFFTNVLKEKVGSDRLGKTTH